MSVVEASAPGKVVLCGEYAVLHGYPAIAAAVNRRARVTLEPGAAGSLELVTRGYMDGSRRLRPRADGGFDYPDGAPAPAAFALFETAWASLRPQDSGGLTVTLDTTEFVTAGGQKLGLGSSAALAAALCAALGDDPRPAAVLPRARALHRQVQGGGSGIDVACAVRGGIVEYRVSDAASAAPTVPGEASLERVRIATRAALPAGLHCAIVWSGRSADTASRISRLAADLKQGAGRASLDALGEQAKRVADCWRDGHASALLAELAAYTGRLSDFDRSHELGIFDGGHRELSNMAAAAGLVYKPCGAGGGDVGAAFALEDRRLEEFGERAASRGALLLDLAIGTDGLRTRE